MSHALSLSSSLISSGALNPDKLSLSFDFAADRSYSKTIDSYFSDTLITSRKGPPANFYRYTAATMIGSHGLITHGPENLIFPSINPYCTEIIKSNVAGDSVITNPIRMEASALNGAHTFYYDYPDAPTIDNYTYSIFLKADGLNFVNILTQNIDDSDSNTVNLTTGAFTAGNNLYSSVYSSEYLGNGWWKIVVVSSYDIIRLSLSQTESTDLESYPGSASQAILYGGAQKERGAIARTYLPTTTAPVYGPRFDYDPVTLASKGLLIEESRENILVFSGDPQDQVITVTAIPHTLSFYGTGTIILAGASVATVIGTGGYPSRRVYTFTPTAGSLTLLISGNVQFAQLERKDSSYGATFATSYIPTFDSPVVRSADMCSISGSDFSSFWNLSSGSLVSSFEASPNTNASYLTVSDGSITSKSFHFDNSSGAMRVVRYDPNATTTIDLGSIGTVGSDNKIAMAYDYGTYRASRNGGTIANQTITIPYNIAVTQMNIGNDERSQTPLSFFTNKHIKTIKYYKKALSSAKLVQMSAL